MRKWLRCHYSVKCEHPLPQGRRLDAALWSNNQGNIQGTMDIALEWEWDTNKVAADFPSGDFRKLLEVDAQCGLAIVQTRADRKGGPTQADDTITNLHRLCKAYRRDSRPVGLIEIRRVLQQKDRVDFICYFQNLDTPMKQETVRWSYP
ncbi:MAG: hypothetical protein HY348_14105 [Nitrospira defluvii]|nr:hypothetical protein [Nitrospira defluvii]